MTYTQKSALIYDLDGTVLDTEFEVSRITASIAHEKGCSASAEDVFINLAGLPSRDKFMALAKQSNITLDDATLTQMSGEHEARKAALYNNPDVPVMPGIANALQTLAAQGYAQSIASSNTSDRSASGLGHAGLLGYFGNHIYGSDNVGGKKKPDPAVFCLAIALRQVLPTQAIIIEDTLAGVIAAKSAGAKVIAYLDPRLGDGPQAQNRMQDLQKAGASAIIRDFAGLPKTVQMLENPAPARAQKAKYTP